MYLSIDNLEENIRNFSLFYGNEGELISGDDYICYMKFSLPEDISIGDFFIVNILDEYIYKSNENSNGIPCVLRFRDKDINNHYNDCFNITNGGIRITSSEPLQTDPPQTDPPQTAPPQTDLPQTDPPRDPPQTEQPQTDSSQTTSTTIELTTTTTTVTTTASESITAENTTALSTSTSVTTTSEETTTEATTKSAETSEVTESNNNEKKNNSLPIVLAVLASIGVLSGIIGFIIKKSKGHGGK